MAELRFDTDLGRSTSQVMMTAEDTMRQQLNNLASNVNNLVGTSWVAPSANQFQGEIDAWRQQVESVLSQLSQLKVRLDSEIAEWESSAASLN